MFLIKYVFRFIPLLVSTVVLACSLPSAGAERLAIEIEEQKSRIASLEQAYENGDVSFVCMHAPQLQMTTSCYNMALALKEIAMWSYNNPNHLPVTIIIEPKEVFLPMKNMKEFNIGYADDFDALLRESLGDKLFTPADMLRDYESFGEMRNADDWCEVKDMLGKVLILLHDCKTTEKYIAVDKSLKSQAMFPMLREEDINRDCASFLLVNEPEKRKKSYIDEMNFVVRTRADKFGNVTDEQCENAFACGAQIISTDYPVKEGITADDYVVSFENYKTISR